MILGMGETAAAIGLSYERFRKVRRELIVHMGFPAPVIGCRWEAEAVRAWVRARSARRPIGDAAARAARIRRGNELERKRHLLEDLRAS